MSDYTELKRLATRIVEVQTSQDVPISKLFDEFEAAACPETILALIAENERLERETGRVNASWHGMKRDLDQLKAENEALRNAAVKVIEMNRQHAEDQYGDSDKAESWSCVTVLRAAMANGEQS